MVFAAVLCASLATPSVTAQAVEFDARVHEAIDRGVAYLLREQKRDGGWESGQQSGAVALALYTLVKSGVPPYEVAVLDAVAAVYEMEPSRTYDTALAILSLGAHDAQANGPRIAELADALIDWQHGDWGYPSGADLSNTQYGALGLWGARRAGVEISPQVWRSLWKAVAEYRSRDGGFCYHSGTSAPTGSMTAAGVGTLAICQDALSTSRALDSGEREQIDRWIREGIGWIAERFSVTSNPGMGSWLYYYLYGLERMGGLTGEYRFGEHDWYGEGAEFLVAQQLKDGGWCESGGWIGGARRAGLGPSDLVSTCFALLFLRRATRPVSVVETVRSPQRFAILEDGAPVRLIATGQDPVTLWIDGFSAETLAALEWPKEAGRGLHIGQVVYFDGDVEIERVAGDSAKPAGYERFAVQHRFRSKGEHRLRTEIHLLAPPVTDKGAPIDHPHVLRSGELRVEIEDLVPDWQREQVGDPGKNLVPLSRPRAKASSVWERDGDDTASDCRPEQAVDGRLGSCWLADPADRTPVLELDFDHPQRARTILVTHALARPYAPAAYTRALELEITVNGRKSFSLRMPYDELHKARLELPEPMAISELSIRIPWSVPGRCAAMGLAEVELQSGD